MTIPFARTIPTVDGRLSPGEWDDASAVSGLIEQFDRTVSNRRAVIWIKRDTQHVYIAHRSTLAPGELTDRPRQPPFWFADTDHSVAFSLASAGGDTDSASHYQFRANAFGRLWQQEVRWTVADHRVRYPQNTQWKSGWRAANHVSADQTRWESEYLVPLADVGETLRGGGAADHHWRVLLARDYPSVEQTALVVSNDWRFGPAVRHWELAAYDNYRIESGYALASVAATAPAVQVLNLDALARGTFNPRIRIANNGPPDRFVVRCAVRDAEHELFSDHQDLRIDAGAWVSAACGPYETVGASLVADVGIEDARGTVLHRQMLPFQGTRASEGRPPDLYFTGGHKEGPDDNVLLSVFNPIRHTLLGRIDLRRLPRASHVARTEIAVRAQSAEQPIFTMSLTTDASGRAERQVTMPVLPPGVYEAVARAWSADGALLGRSRELFLRYDHASALPWLDNAIGISTRVLPPWTPIEAGQPAAGAAMTLRVTDRIYRIGGSGLPTHMDAAGASLLAAPASIEVVAGGAVVPWTSEPSPAVDATLAHIVNYRGRLESANWTLTTTGALE